MKRENVEIVSTDGCQVFSVPNTITGREFVRLLRVYINTDRYAIRARGRAQDRKKKGGNGQDIKAKRADWLAVYVQGVIPANNRGEVQAAYKDGHMNGERIQMLREKIMLEQRAEYLGRELEKAVDEIVRTPALREAEVKTS